MAKEEKFTVVVTEIRDYHWFRKTQFAGGKDST